MNDESSPATPPPDAGVSRRSALLGLTAVGGIGAATVGGFGFARGLLAPDKLTPSRFADRFERVYGTHGGFRRNHAKGLAASGHFTSNGAGIAVSKAAIFREGTVPVTGRFSLSGGLPCAPDAADVVRGMGLMFELPGGEQWRTAMVNIPVFLDSTPQNFVDRLLTSKPVADTGKPDPDKVSAYLAKHPETVAAMKIVHKHPPASGFENSTFHGLNAFGFTNSGGATVPVRWMVVPEQSVHPAGSSAPPDKNYLFDTLIRKAADKPLKWRLILTIGRPQDPTDDATKPWPKGRKTIDVGTLTIDSVHTEDAGNARDINFDPLVLPDGIEPLDDPLLNARSAVYARSFERRTSESKQPSKVNVAEVLDEQ